MSESDVIAFVALLVSLIAFGVTTYEQFLKGAELTLVLGEKAYLSCWKVGKELSGMGLVAAVSLVNSGASDALIMRIEGDFVHTTSSNAAPSWQAAVAWESFLTMTPQDAKPGKPWQPEWSMESWARPLISPSRKASTTWISFSVYPLPEPHELVVGDYELRLSLVVAHVSQLARRLHLRHEVSGISQYLGQFSLDADQLQFLLTNCVGTEDYVPDTLPVTIQPMDS